MWRRSKCAMNERAPHYIRGLKLLDGCDVEKSGGAVLLLEVACPVAGRQDLRHAVQETRGVRAVDRAVVEGERQHPDRVDADRLGTVASGDDDRLSYDGVGRQDRDLGLIDDGSRQ